MKIFDINTAIGHWPFRRLEIDTVAKLRKNLEAHEICGAAVVNINGLFYLNCHDANMELHEWLKGHEDFFKGVATINPFYASWDKDLTECVKKLKFRGVRLVPQYHDYELASVSDELPQMAASLNIPVFIPAKIIDIRQRHWMDTEKAVGFDPVYNFCIKYPDTKVVYTEASVSAEGIRDKKKCPNLFIEISRMRSSYRQQISRLASAIGCGQLLFGSGAPFKEISPVLLKLHHADLTDNGQKQIAYKNASNLLKLKDMDKAISKALGGTWQEEP